MRLTGQTLVIDTKAVVPALSTAHHAQMPPVQTPSSDPCTDEILHLWCYTHTCNKLVSKKTLVGPFGHKDNTIHKRHKGLIYVSVGTSAPVICADARLLMSLKSGSYNSKSGSKHCCIEMPEYTPNITKKRCTQNCNSLRILPCV